VAQLARASGSYPLGHWFDSSRRYQTPFFFQKKGVPKKIEAVHMDGFFVFFWFKLLF
jgi:hypothetical protein